MVVQERRRLLGAQALGARGEAHDVGEQHGHLAILGDQRGRRPAADQALDDLARHVDGEHAQHPDHRVERDRGLVDLLEPRAAQRRDVVEIEGPDRARCGGELADRAADPAAEQDGSDHRDEQRQKAEPGSQRQAIELRIDRLLGEVAADQPALVERRRQGLIEVDVLGVAQPLGVTRDVDLEPAVLPALAPDPEQHRIADLIDPRQRPLHPEAGEIQCQRAVREHAVVIVQDERVLPELGLEAGDELGQRAHGDGRGEHAPDLAIEDHRPAQVDHRHARILEVDRRAPIGLAPWPAERLGDGGAAGEIVPPVGDLRPRRAARANRRHQPARRVEEHHRADLGAGGERGLQRIEQPQRVRRDRAGRSRSASPAPRPGPPPARGTAGPAARRR